MGHRKITRKRFLAGVGLSALFPGSIARSLTGKNTHPSAPVDIRGSVPGPLVKTGVLVVGGGPAGIGAALGACRTGAEAFLVENYGFLGGVGTWSLGMSINQMRPEGLPRSDVHEQVIDRLNDYGPRALKLVKHGILCNVDYFKVALLDALEESGCPFLVHTKVVDTLMKEDRVSGVLVSTKQGLAKIEADVVIDCTGDADVAYFSGAATLKDPGVVSPQTLAFRVSHVKDDGETYRHRMDRDRVKFAREKYRMIPERWSVSRIANDHSFYVNHAGTRDFGHFDITDPFVFTRAECLSRRQVIEMTEAAREFGPDSLRESELSGTGPQIGVRESRRIRGLYVLNEEDALNGSTFPDAIAWRSGPMDVGFTRYSKMKTHDVPYRSLLPEKVDGLLAAGRCVSATHLGTSSG